MSNKIIKICLIVSILVLVVFLVRNNVTLTREPVVQTGDNSMILEVNSEVVQNIYDKLLLLNGGNFNDEVYGNLFFDYEEDEKILSPDEKLYLTFENLYSKGVFSIENEDENIEVLKIDLSSVKSKYEELYKEEFKSEEVEYKVSKDSGIIDYSLEEGKVLLKFKKVKPTQIRKARIESAVKNGNFIELSVKAFVASETHSKNNDEIYLVTNYGKNRVLKRATLEELSNDSIFDILGLNSYVFSFELKEEEYCLRSIKKNSNVPT